MKIKFGNFSIDGKDIVFDVGNLVLEDEDIINFEKAIKELRIQRKQK